MEHQLRDIVLALDTQAEELHDLLDSDPGFDSHKTLAYALCDINNAKRLIKLVIVQVAE